MVARDGKTQSFDAYAQDCIQALATVDAGALHEVVEIIGALRENRRRLYTCGNGGSAANANHFAQDLSNLSLSTGRLIPVISLSAAASTLTAVANDFGYERVFSHQLELYAQPGDALLVISGSGNSTNVVRATEWGNAHGLTTMALVGYDGGRLRQTANVCVHVASFNMGLVEGLHLLCLDFIAKAVTEPPPDR